MRELLHLIPAVFALALSVLLLAAPRFGRASWMLSCFFALPAIGFGFQVFGDGTIASFEAEARVGFASLLAALPTVLLFLWALDRPDYLDSIRRRRKTLIALATPVPVLGTLVFLHHPLVDDPSLVAEGFVALGPSGYLGSLFLLTVSVMTLANLEQVLRTVEERVRWQLKFLALGLVVSVASIIYVGSKVLLYPIRFGLVPLNAIQLFPVISLLSVALVFVSWRRSSQRGVITVSHDLVYSSITLVSVGIYLIISSLTARWAARLGGGGAQLEVFIFLLFAVVLGVVLLSSGFRHRVRYWLRRNVFAGRYDYRQYWIEANDTVRSIASLETTARVLAEITQRALGAIDVSVWFRERNPNRLRHLASLGDLPANPSEPAHGLVEELVPYTEPISAAKVAGEKVVVDEFMRQTRAELLVPLVSSERLVGVMTVGSDRSGREYDGEARDFLRVLAGHAAAELHKSELLATLVQAKEAEAFRTFSTFLLHDLKNFASTLSLIAKNAARLRSNPEFQSDAFQSVLETAEKMKRLCNSLTTFSGNLASNRKVQDLNHIVREAAEQLTAGFEGRLRLALADLPPVLVDREEIGRVVQNLLLNTREAVAEPCEIVVETAPVNGKVGLLVRDSGPGMNREFLKNSLFQPFHTTKPGGLGIGLFQCKKIVEAHGGSILVESQVGTGTTVRVLLPCA
jgi:putative PEP-CTERM system histidine kinase